MRKHGWIQVVMTTMLLLTLFVVPAPPVQGSKTWNTYLPAVLTAPRRLCRFGITSRYDLSGYIDPNVLYQLKSGALIDWNYVRPDSLAADIQYVHIVTTGENYSPNALKKIPELVKKSPGDFWQVGNEPDTCVYQDCATPEEYAQQYYDIATTLRSNDPTAKIAFGSIVQPTPIRLVYMERAWTELIRLAGGKAQASALVDIWSIHAFLLGEKPGEWGTGLPKGMDGTEAPLLRFGPVDDGVHYAYSRTHDVALLEEMVRGYRAWMNAKGERAKPLWITEYGSAFPPIDPPGRDAHNVSDADTADFMVKSFDFFRSATDDHTGMPGDNNLLVQRWFWYIINDYRYRFGGVLFDIETGQSTLVGKAYMNYTASLPADTSCTP